MGRSQAGGRRVTTIKRHTDSLRALCRWAVRRGRLKADPTVGLELASGELDRRRIRRAYTDEEFAKLLVATQIRPERDAGLIRRGPRKGQLGNLKPEVRERMQLLGRERSLIYRVLLLTGFRLDELRSPRVSQATLDGQAPAIKLDAVQAKSRRAQRVELPDTLAAELGRWIRERGLKPTDKLLIVPDDFDRVFRLDAALAGLEVMDENGRSLDTHALRHTLATRLADDGVPLVVTQSIMRHSDPRLTAGAYLDAEALTTKKPAIDQVSHDLIVAVAESWLRQDPEGTRLPRELAVQPASTPPGKRQPGTGDSDVYALVRRSLAVGRDQVKEFEVEIRRAAERAFQRFTKLPGQDSNLEKQDQNLL